MSENFPMVIDERRRYMMLLGLLWISYLVTPRGYHIYCKKTYEEDRAGTHGKMP